MKTKYEYIKEKMGSCLNDSFSHKVKHMSDSFEKLIMDAFAEGYHKGLVEGFKINESKEQEPKCGKWIIDYKEDWRIWHCHCSNCEKDPQEYIGGTEDWWLVHLPKYCPNCGARMEGGEE